MTDIFIEAMKENISKIARGKKNNTLSELIDSFNLAKKNTSEKAGKRYTPPRRIMENVRIKNNNVLDGNIKCHSIPKKKRTMREKISIIGIRN